MKRLMIAVLALACSASHAADPKNYPVSLNFSRVELAELSHLVYGEILKQDFVISPDVIANIKPVSIRMTSDKNTLASTYAAFLQGQGIDVTLRKNIVWLTKKSEDSEQTEVFSYRPKHRKVEFLQDMLRPFVQGKIVAQQVIRKAENETVAVNPPKGSAANLIDRDYDLLLVEASKADIKRINALLPQIDTPVAERRTPKGGERLVVMVESPKTETLWWFDRCSHDRIRRFCDECNRGTCKCEVIRGERGDIRSFTRHPECKLLMHN
jgi:type II secretory pathway component GspD/PulD (secretin)